MKALTLLLAVATLGLSAVCFVQWQKLHEQQIEATALRTEKEQQATQLKEFTAKQDRAEQKQRELARYADDVAAELIAHTVAASNALAKAVATNLVADAAEEKPQDKELGGFGKMLGKMMEDPAMKKMIQAQQRLMMDQLYGPLIKKLELTPEETDKFKNLLADHTMKATEAATSLFGADGGTNHAEFASSMADQQKDFEAQVKDLLGDTRYGQYKDYQETAGERAQLNLFQQQNAGSQNALSDQQTEQLLSFMKEAKQSVAAAGQPVMGNGQDPATMEALLSGDQTDKLMQTQEEINQRVYDRAKTVLTASQLDSFGQYQTNQLQMMRFGMSMAQKMFKSDKSSAGPAPGGQ